MIGRRGASCRIDRPAGFALVEAVISVVIVGVLMVVALNTVGAAKVGQAKAARRSRAALLGEAMMAEILPLAYEDPAEPDSLALEAGEDGGSRANFDDVDDYDGWSASPPEAKGGTPIVGAEDYRRVVKVVWANAADPSQQAAVNTGVKRIEVTVFYKGQDLFTLSALRTGSGPKMAAAVAAAVEVGG